MLLVEHVAQHEEQQSRKCETISADRNVVNQHADLGPNRQVTIPSAIPSTLRVKMFRGYKWQIPVLILPLAKDLEELITLLSKVRELRLRAEQVTPL